jgi:hypothetical protein
MSIARILFDLSAVQQTAKPAKGMLDEETRMMDYFGYRWTGGNLVVPNFKENIAKQFDIEWAGNLKNGWTGVSGCRD